MSDLTIALLFFSIVVVGIAIIILTLQYKVTRGRIRVKDLIDIDLQGQNPRTRRRTPLVRRQATPRHAWLAVRGYDERQWRYVLEQSQRRWVIGRDPACDVRLPYDKEVKPRHALLQSNGSHYWVRPLEGHVFVNARPIQSHQQIKNGQEIRIGRTRFVFKQNTEQRR